MGQDSVAVYPSTVAGLEINGKMLNPLTYDQKMAARKRIVLHMRIRMLTPSDNQRLFFKSPVLDR